MILASAAGLLALAALAVLIGRTASGRVIVYGGSLVATAIAAVVGGAHLLGGAETATVTLPLGLPWLGAHFRIDALTAFFLVVVEFGGAAATSTRSAMAGTRKRLSASCRSILRFSPA